MASDIPMGLVPSHQMIERDIHDYQLPDSIGVKWKDLARALGYLQTAIDIIREERGNPPKECCIDLLVRWMRREGRDATAGRLADALTSIGLKDLADILICPSDPSQINEFEKEIREMKSKLVSLEAKGSKLSARNKELEEEVSKMRTRNEELEKQLLNTRQKCHKTEQENQTLRARLEPEDAREHDQEEDDNSEGTDQAERENRIDNKLKNINEQLRTYVTSPLQVPEVKQDQLRTPVKLDLLIRLSERLQELYTETLGMVGEACKCNEDLRRDYYDLAYHGLRAEHNDLIHKVKDLESAREEMSEEEKKEYERLQGYQRARKSQVEGLDKLWRRLFSSPERLHKTPVSQPTGKKPNGGKKATRHTDPGARPKKPKSREDDDNDDGKSDDESLVNRVTKMKSAVETVIQNISPRKRETGNKQGSCVPYTLMRDS